MEDAEECWRCNFIPPGTLVAKPDGEVLLVLGDVQYLALLCWPVVVEVTKNDETFYTLQAEPPASGPE
eukprot:9934078-Lingulodinium_polyedra.AAC.1